MKWKSSRAGWHRWFAWHPVSIDDRWVWLEMVERCHHEPLVWCDWTEYRFAPSTRAMEKP